MYLDDRMHDTLAEMPSFPQGHLLMTTLLVDDRLRGLNRWNDVKEHYTQIHPRNDETSQIDGPIRNQQVLQNRVPYPERTLYPIHPDYKIGAVLCMKQTLYPKDGVRSHKGDHLQENEEIIEEIEERVSFSPVERVVTDPLSYLTSR